jgi:hypothetical protein
LHKIGQFVEEGGRRREAGVAVPFPGGGEAGDRESDFVCRIRAAKVEASVGRLAAAEEGERGNAGGVDCRWGELAFFFLPVL